MGLVSPGVHRFAQTSANISASPGDHPCCQSAAAPQLPAKGYTGGEGREL